MDSTQKRIFLWTCPRSLSTAFYRAINNAPGTLGIFEPYSSIFGYIVRQKRSGTSTFEEITEKLNEPYTGYNTIFAKDMPYCLNAAPNNIEDILPEGYIHTFLIRSPRKSVTSFYSMFTGPDAEEWDNFERRQVATKPLYELYTFLTKTKGLECLIVDADDLENSPEAVLIKYCEFAGIEFHPSMVDWEKADPSKVDAFHEVTGRNVKRWFKTALNTTTFRKPAKQPTLDVSSLPPMVQELIEENMPYYDLLYKDKVVIS